MAISWITFACVFGSALLGMLLRKLLTEHHLDADSRNIVNLGMALIATTSALVLGLLIASAKSSYDAQSWTVPLLGCCKSPTFRCATLSRISAIKHSRQRGCIPASRARYFFLRRGSSAEAHFAW